MILRQDRVHAIVFMTMQIIVAPIQNSEGVWHKLFYSKFDSQSMDFEIFFARFACMKCVLLCL